MSYEKVKLGVRIGQIHCSGSQPDYAILEVSIAGNDVQILKADLSHEQLGLLLSNKEVEVEGEFGNTDLVGYVSERKTEFVAVHEWADGVQGRKLTAEEALRPYEVEGWKGRADDFGGRHKFPRTYEGVEGFYVSFHRWVHEKTGEPRL